MSALYRPIYAIKWKTHNLTHRRFFHDNNDMLFLMTVEIINLVNNWLRYHRLIFLVSLYTIWPYSTSPHKKCPVLGHNKTSYMSKLVEAQNSARENILAIKLKDKIKNEEIYSRTSPTKISYIINKLKIN